MILKLSLQLVNQRLAWGGGWGWGGGVNPPLFPPSYNSGLARRSRAKLWVAVKCWTDHLLKKIKKYWTENFGAINVLVTSLHAISDPKVAIVCESIKGKLLNGNAYKTQVRRKTTSSTKWLSRICDILWFWPQNFKNIFCFWMNKNDHKPKI